MDLYEEIARLRREGRKAALATIVRRQGSTPRKDRAKMLVYEDGSTLGSVGGGCTEAEVWREARQVMESGQSSILKFELTEKDVENEGLVCGGTIEIFLEPILPDPKVILMGAGHVAKAISEAASRLGFKVAVLDDRAAFASAERFPEADEIVVESFERSLERINVSENSFILILTRGHAHDQIACEKALRTRARYVGLLGSRRKIQLIVENLLERGHPPEAFARLYAPVGIEIGSETPEEIAVSVVAELIALLKGVHQRSSKQLFLEKVLARHTAVQT